MHGDGAISNGAGAGLKARSGRDVDQEIFYSERHGHLLLPPSFRETTGLRVLLPRPERKSLVV